MGAKSPAPGRRLAALQTVDKFAMSSSKRDRLRREIFDSLPVERIIAAALLMMRWQLTDPPSDVDFARFIASLNVGELHELRRLAQQAEGGTVH
jgi:hypothetical protein